MYVIYIWRLLALLPSCKTHFEGLHVREISYVELMISTQRENKKMSIDDVKSHLERSGEIYCGFELRMHIFQNVSLLVPFSPRHSWHPLCPPNHLLCRGESGTMVAFLLKAGLHCKQTAVILVAGRLCSRLSSEPSELHSKEIHIFLQRSRIF